MQPPQNPQSKTTRLDLPIDRMPSIARLAPSIQTVPGSPHKPKMTIGRALGAKSQNSGWRRFHPPQEWACFCPLENDSLDCLVGILCSCYVRTVLRKIVLLLPFHDSFKLIVCARLLMTCILATTGAPLESLVVGCGQSHICCQVYRSCGVC